ncbi:MAG: DMT family transporter [Pseudorhodoferax sp.]
MQASHAPGRATGFVLVVLTAAGWGVGWTVFKHLIGAWPPLFARGAAGLLGAACLCAVARLSGRSLRVPRALWPRLGLAACLNVFVWMGFTALALRWLNVAEGTLLTYTMPLWASLLAWLLLHERLGARDLAGLLLGFGGVVVLVAGPGLSTLGQKLPGVGLALAAALLFAYGSVRAKAPMPLDPLAATAWQVGLGSLAMVAASLALEHPALHALGPTHLGALLYVAMVPMAVCYLTWFAALQRLPASTAAMGSLLVPVFGTATAAWWLREPLGPSVYAAFAMVLGGVLLALARR